MKNYAKNLAWALFKSTRLKILVVGCAWGVDRKGVYGANVSEKFSLTKKGFLRHRHSVHLAAKPLY